LDAVAILRFRSHHYDAVALRRRVELPRGKAAVTSLVQFDVVLEAVQVAAVRARAAHLDLHDDGDIRRVISDLQPYAGEVGHRVRVEVLEVASRVALRTRRGLPLDLISAVSDIVQSAAVAGMPIVAGVRKVPDEEVHLVEHGASIGAAIAMDGCDPLRDLHVVDAGADVLWLGLRAARAAGLRGLQSSLRRWFAQVRDRALSARGGPFDDASRWLTFKEADALSLPGEEFPEMPKDLDTKLSDLRDKSRWNGKRPSAR